MQCWRLTLHVWVLDVTFNLLLHNYQFFYIELYWKNSHNNFRFELIFYTIFMNLMYWSTQLFNINFIIQQKSQGQVKFNFLICCTVYLMINMFYTVSLCWIWVHSVFSNKYFWSAYPYSPYQMLHILFVIIEVLPDGVGASMNQILHVHSRGPLGHLKLKNN